MSGNELIVQITAIDELSAQLQPAIETTKQMWHDLQDWANKENIDLSACSMVSGVNAFRVGMRRAGIAPKASPRRRTVSTKRAMIYQRKALLAQRTH